LATKTVNRRARKLFNQHEITPFKTKADVSILEDFDFDHFREQIKEKAPCPLHIKIEQTSKHHRIHFHITATEDIPPNTFKQLIKSCLQGERTDIKVEKFDDKRAKNYCEYIAKETYYNTLKNKQCEIALKKFYKKNPAELGKQTYKERLEKLVNVILYQNTASAQRLREYYFSGVLKLDEMLKPAWLTRWGRFLKYNHELAQQYELRLFDTNWFEAEH
jgi:hypothetical protein